jgi:uracil-DNA glycosylase family 4
MNDPILTFRDLHTLNNAIVDCRRCPRLVTWREEVAMNKRRAYIDWEYWGKPVTGFGDINASILVVGLAPGAHGANRTGRMFTGDSSGDFLFSALYAAGFANQPQSSQRCDGLELKDMYISAVCRCVPPKNKPTNEEITNCLDYLKHEIKLLDQLAVIVVLGRIAFTNILRVYQEWGYQFAPMDFVHGAQYELGKNLPKLVVSYHPSRQNTQTGRLTSSMFDQIWESVRFHTARP